MNSKLKMTGAIAAGFVVVFILSSVGDVVMESTGVFPPRDRPDLMTDGLLAIATFYRVIFTILGGFVTARFAPDRPMWHAMVLGGIGTAAGILGAVIFWSYGHHWYPIALIVTAFPCSWLGAKLKTRSA